MEEGPEFWAKLHLVSDKDIAFFPLDEIDSMPIVY